jgi:hypothetical protein
MSARCFCDMCNGTLVSRQTRLNHQRKQLKNETISQQIQRKYEVLPATQQVAGPSSFVSHLPSGTLVSATEDDVFMDVIYDTTPEILPGAVDVNQQDGTANGEYVLDNQEEELLHEDDVDFPDEDSDAPEDLEDRGAAAQSISLTDRPLVADPFVVENRAGTSNDREPKVSEHLLVVYAIIAWLHFQFHLPRVACNALLAFLARLLRYFDPTATSPFVTLLSATRALGVDPAVELLAVCPKCRDVYPSSGSRHAQEKCNTCHIDLFLPDHTRRGNSRAVKTPVIKYPYIPLSEQVRSILKIPGIEASLENWRNKPRSPGEYGDIFDGKMCRLKLKAPDGSLFFSNRPQERHGPNNELRIGVNLGVDWCCYERTFSYRAAVIPG